MDILKNLENIHQKVANDVWGTNEVMVKCTICGKELKVNPAICLKNGWPKCCGYTMRLQSDKDK